MKLINLLQKKTQVPELGVELEMEGFSRGYQAKKKLPKRLYNKYILKQTTDDTVLDDSTEIIFKHFPLREWNPVEISEILKNFRDNGLRSGESAGMHIHYSSPKIEQIYESYDTEEKNIIKTDRPGFITSVLNNIGARTGYFNGAYVCGVGLDTWDKKEKDEKTIEIRAFESTTHTNIFYLRLCVVDYLMNYLSYTPYHQATERLFQDMPNSIKNQYYLLCTANNPNRYGWRPEIINERLFGQKAVLSR